MRCTVVRYSVVAGMILATCVMPVAGISADVSSGETGGSEPGEDIGWDDFGADSAESSLRYTLSSAQYLGVTDEPVWSQRELSAGVNWWLKKGAWRYEAEGWYATTLFPGEKTDTFEEKVHIYRNLRVSSREDELQIRTAAAHYTTGSFRFSGGIQVHAWGTTDVFNPTSYFNPYDLRRFLLKDRKKLRMGVFSLSALWFLGNDSLELVVVPLHTPMAYPERSDFWGVQYREGPFPVVIDGPEALSLADGFGTGLQYYTNQGGFDIHGNLYWGPEQEPSMRPMGTVVEPGEPVALEVQPWYGRYLALGGSVSKTLGDFSLQSEFTVSPNRTGVVNQDYTSGIPTLPFETRQAGYLSYAAGANWFVPVSSWLPSHKGKAVLTTEWFQSFWLDDEVMEPLISNILTVRAEDTFLADRLHTSITWMTDTRYGAHLLWPRIGYRIEKGPEISLGYVLIAGGGNSFMGFYERNDGIEVRCRYEF